MRTVLSLLACLSGLNCALAENSVVIGDLRIQAIGDTVLRFELRGPHGFEDRTTFCVQSRKLADKLEVLDKQRVSYGSYVIRVDGPEVSVLRSNNLIYRAAQAKEERFFLPSPGSKWTTFLLRDNPRLVPPIGGAVPSVSTTFRKTSGWDATNDAPDHYLFLNKGGYRQLVKDYLDLTGRIEMPPLYMFGLMDSRYYPYSDQTAMETIKKYRDRGFPLDVFVLDTDWRINASKGYEVNTKLWPDLAGFTAACRQLGVRTMVNDHPEAQADSALDFSETLFRWRGLTNLLAQGIDVLWYDRNWITKLKEPMPGIPKEIWGQRVFHDITAAYRPQERPLILANVDGIDNGVRKKPPYPGFHRYPFTWTGDTAAQWPFLKAGVENAVNAGLDSLLPYVSEDLTGHTGRPTPELYVRFMQYGCLSPVTRIHCAAGQTRLPWDYGDKSEAIVRDFVHLRHRLLPMIYTAARRAYDEGVPLLRRCDWEWPTFAEASDPTQYMFGDDLLVAPIVQSVDALAPKVGSRWQSLSLEYFESDRPEGKPAETKSVSRLEAVPGGQWHSVRWRGKVLSREAGEHVWGLDTSVAGRLFVDGQVVVNATSPGLHARVSSMDADRVYDVVIESPLPKDGLRSEALFAEPSQRRTLAERSVWIPPGQWNDVYTGKVWSGPARITVQTPLDKLPLFRRDGALIWTATEVKSTADGVFKNIGLDVTLPSRNVTTLRELYEDDGHSLAYQSGKFSQTTARLERKAQTVTLTLSSPIGEKTLVNREFIAVQLHQPQGSTIKSVWVDGRRQTVPRHETGNQGVSQLFTQQGALMVPVADGKAHVVKVALAPARYHQGE